MENFKIGIMVDSLKLGFEKGIEKAAQLGASGVQIYATAGDFSPENMTKEKISEYKKIIKDNGLTVSALCGDLGGHGFAIKEDNNWKVEKSKRIMDLALEFETKAVTTHIGVIPSDSDCEKYKIMSEACFELAKYGDDVGARFAIETGPEKCTTLKKFLDGLTSKGVGVNFDPANLIMVTDDDPVAGVRLLKDYIVHTHAKDGIMIKKTDPQIIYNFFAEGGIEDLRLEEYFKELPLGEGKVDFDNYLKALKEIGYNGFLTIERECGEYPEKDILLAVNFLKSKI